LTRKLTQCIGLEADLNCKLGNGLSGAARLASGTAGGTGWNRVPGPIVEAWEVVMRTEEITKLSREVIAELVRVREQSEEAPLVEADERRRHPRWPFPGAIELWPTGSDGAPRWFASCGNLSYTGIGMLTDRPLEPGMEVELACHFPEITVYGSATIRHCTPARKGYIVGAEFKFDD